MMSGSGNRAAILVTGTRHALTPESYRRVGRFLWRQMQRYERGVLFVGDATGVDALARTAARKLNARAGYDLWQIRCYKADWDRYNNAAGPKRNQKMTRDFAAHHGPRLAFAFPATAAANKGTRNCMRCLIDAGHECRVLPVHAQQ